MIKYDIVIKNEGTKETHQVIADSFLEAYEFADQTYSGRIISITEINV